MDTASNRLLSPIIILHTSSLRVFYILCPNPPEQATRYAGPKPKEASRSLRSVEVPVFPCLVRIRNGKQQAVVHVAHSPRGSASFLEGSCVAGGHKLCCGWRFAVYDGDG